jgi:KUP system potassium uptake protein
MTPTNSHAASPHGRHLWALSVGALGVVFGDIGTSPLYALRVCFDREMGLPVSEQNILGVLSLIFWALTLTISIKYLIFILRADNRGEGGILALMALARPEHASVGRKSAILIGLGLFGAALLYGDGIITPAISVMSAVEGLEVATPVVAPFVVPITTLLLIGLFLLQRRGTGGVGALFGPVMMVWFLVIGLLGIHGILKAPGVLAGLNPLHALTFFLENKVPAFLALGAIFLVETGGEALYADMGHFGRKPIRLAWFTLVLPCLLLNYFGQGAELLLHPAAEENPFFWLAPSWSVIPLVVLATAATIIASQAVISGSFSLTRQAIQLGFSPRMLIRHTSKDEIGQIYVPAVNWALMVATIALVVAFKSSDNLAAAYGVAVTTTMVITTILFYVVATERWRWSPWVAAPLCGLFLAVDAAFFSANIIKVEHGGWLPLLIALGIFTLMSTWKRGRNILGERLSEETLDMDIFLADIERREPVRVPGTAVFMTGNPKGVPPALLHNLKHNHVLHQRVVLVTIVTEEEPRVGPARRLQVVDLGHGLYRLVAHYGFMETPHVPRLLESARSEGLEFPVMETTFFLGWETVIPSSSHPGMARWREWLFAVMSRNAQRATAYFRIPVNRVVELGQEVEI